MSDEKQDRTFLTFVLDETGSMSNIKDDTIGGFNDYISQLQQSGEPIDFTLIKFDSNRHAIPYRAVNVHDVKPLDNESYRPGAAMPLIDAVYKAIKATEEKAGDASKVIIAVQTDGYENASREFTNAQLVQLVKEKTAAGWLVFFTGARSMRSPKRESSGSTQPIPCRMGVSACRMGASAARRCLPGS